MGDSLNKTGPEQHAPAVVCDAVCDKASPSGDNGSRVQCSRCGADVPVADHCGACGAWLRGNEGNLRHGLRRYQTTGVLPPDLKVSVDEFRDQLISDQGGLENLSAIHAGLCRNLVDCEVGTRLNMNVVIQQGLNSRPGRAAYDRLLATLDRWSRIAGVLGLSRRPKDVDDSLEAYIARQTGTAASGATIDRSVDSEIILAGDGPQKGEKQQ